MKPMLLTAALLGLLASWSAVEAIGNADAGKAKAAGCAGCHGASGEGTASYPKIAGQPAEKFIETMKDYKSGKRKNAIMKSFASKLSDQDLDDLAAYYASSKTK